MEGKTLPVTHVLRRQHGFIKSIATVVLVAFTSLYLQPLALAAQLPPAAPAAQPAPASNEEKLARTLEDIEDRLGKYEDRLVRKEDATREKDELKRLRKDLDELDRQALADFEKIGKHLKDRNLPKVILDRHAEAVATYKAEMETLKANVDDIETAPKDEDKRLKARNAKNILKARQKKRPHAPVDPNKLPFRISGGKARKPATTKDEFEKLGIFGEQPIHLASLQVIPGLFAQASVSAALPSTQDLAFTEDAPLTEDIKSLAARLDHNPVKIYNWVYNSIHFTPTYGSVQGAQMCLETKQCNSFDSSSLLIALLRASGIHSRYVYGTIEVPAETFATWIGGSSDPNVAWDLVASAGVPITAVTSAGKVSKFRVEHVWVEAFIDFQPSRGAIHKEGDTWTSLDPSYKGMEFVNLNISDAIGFSAGSVATQLKSTAQIDESLGRVTNVDQVLILNTFNQYKIDAEAYLTSLSTEIVMRDYLYGKIRERTQSVLSANLPYRVVAVAGRSPSVPEILRHSVEISMFASELDQSLDSPTLTHQISLPKLQAKRLSVSYVPATAADAELIDSYKQANATSLPAYLIHVKPVLTVDGVVVASGYAVTMGDRQVWRIAFRGPVSAQQDATTYSVTAGDEVVFSINGNGLTPDLVQKRMKSIPPNTIGEQLHVAGLHYWMEHDLFDAMAAKAHGIRKQRLPSGGSFALPLTVNYFFGIARSANYRAKQADVKRVLLAIGGGNSASRYAFMSQAGLQGSYFEGSVFDQLFLRPQGKSFSATQLLLDAASQGIPIYFPPQG